MAGGGRSQQPRRACSNPKPPPWTLPLFHIPGRTPHPQQKLPQAETHLIIQPAVVHHGAAPERSKKNACRQKPQERPFPVITVKPRKQRQKGHDADDEPDRRIPHHLPHRKCRRGYQQRDSGPRRRLLAFKERQNRQSRQSTAPAAGASLFPAIFPDASLCETSGGSNGQKTAQDKKAIHSHAPSAIPSPAVMEKDNRQAQQNSQQIQSIIPDRQHIRKPTDKQSVTDWRRGSISLSTGSGAVLCGTGMQTDVPALGKRVR